MRIQFGSIIIATLAIARNSGVVDEVRLRNAGGDGAAGSGISLPGSGDR